MAGKGKDATRLGNEHNTPPRDERGTTDGASTNKAAARNSISDIVQRIAAGKNISKRQVL